MPPFIAKPPAFDIIPTEFKRLKKWVAWKWVTRDGKLTKPPYDPCTGGLAATDAPGTWGTFGQAVAAWETGDYGGIGIVLTPDDPYFGVDLDKCLDPETGQAEEWAREIVRELDSYTEVSPSGMGLRIFCRGKLPSGRRRKGCVEMYDWGRYLTTTGHQWDGTPSIVEDRDDEIARVHARLFPPATTRTASSTASPLFTDGEILDLCRRAANGGKFEALYRGDTSGYGGDDSAADAALCALLAFYTQDIGQIERLVAGSGLCREKWTGRPDYRQRTITLAMTGLSETYSPPGVGMKGGLNGVGEHRNGRADPASLAPGAPPIPSRHKPIGDRTIDLADVEPPGELPLLFGNYLMKGSAHWLTGQTGLGKSTFAFNLACALAEGRPLWGVGPDSCKVLYLDMESGDLGRSLKVDRLYRDGPRVRGRLLFLREPVRLPEESAELIEYVRAGDFGLVIFDTARRCFSVKDENDNAEVYNRIIPTLDALKALGVASLTMGHPPKNGAAGARGAGAQEDAGDVNLTLTMHRGEVSDPDGVIALRVTKNRLLGFVPPLYLRKVGQDRFERMAEEEASPVDGATEKAPTATIRCGHDILDFLAQCDSPTKHGQIVKEMVLRGHAEGTAKKAIKAVQDAGKIGHDQINGYVLLEEAQAI